MDCIELDVRYEHPYWISLDWVSKMDPCPTRSSVP